MRIALPTRPLGWALLTLAAILLVALILLLVVATIDPARFKGKAEAELSRRFGRPVTIGSLAREGGPSLSPLIHVTDVRVPQPAWAPAGTPPMATIRDVRVELPLIPLLLGHGKPERIEIRGMRLLLIRDAAGRANWQGGKRAGKPTGFARLSIRDSQVVLQDAKKDRSARLSLAAEPETGFRAAGTTLIRGTPGTLAVQAEVGGLFAARLTGPALSASLAGRMGPAFNSGKFTARMTAKGDDLRLLDAVIEAGLPGTQPFALAATIEHDRPRWIVRDLAGTIGRSRLGGRITVHKQNGRSKVDATIHAAALDFDDLASDAQLARGAARRRLIGPRLVPETRIALDRMRRTDGTLTFRIDRLLWKEPAPFRAMQGRVRLDHAVMTLDRLQVALPQGRITGAARIRHPSGEPLLTLDLRMAGARVTDFFGGGTVTGSLAGRAKLEGTGRTVREAVARSTGHFALVARDGQMDRKAAELLGRNVGRALRTDAGERTAMRCLIANFAGRSGHYAPAPLVLDTGVMRADGRGALEMASERLALTLDGKSKVPAAFRLSGPILVTGTLKAPNAAPTAEATSTRGILKSIGQALSGPQVEAAGNADCAGLAARALR